MSINFQKSQLMLLICTFMILIPPLSVLGATQATEEVELSLICQEPSGPNFGGKILLFGDSFGSLLQDALGKMWLSGTRKDLLDETPLPHISAWFPDSKISTGLAQPYEIEKTSKKKIFYPQKLFNLIAEYELKPQRIEADKQLPSDIVIIWFGANDFNSFLKDDQVSIPLGYPGWFDNYQARLESLMNICGTKKLDCYILTPTDSNSKTAPSGHGQHMAEIKKRIESTASGANLQNSVTVIDMWLLREKFPKNERNSDYAHPNMYGFDDAGNEVNDAIVKKRGFDLKKLADKLRRC